MAIVSVNSGSSKNIDEIAWNRGDVLLVYEGSHIVIDTEPVENPQGKWLCQVQVTDINVDVFVDSRQVKHVYFTGASGSIAYDDVVTGGTSGATGKYIRTVDTSCLKLKQVSGTFVDGEALSTAGGWAATQSGAMRVGCLTVCMERTDIFSCFSRSSLQFNGDWFYLPNTDGTTALPLNDYDHRLSIPVLWVETGVGTDEYQVWLNRTTQIPIGEIGDHAEFGNYFYHDAGDTSISFGDGTNGVKPITGLKVRVPSLLIGPASNTVDGVIDYNSVVSQFPSMSAGNLGDIIFDKVAMSGFTFNATGASSVSLTNSSSFYHTTISNTKGSTVVDNYAWTPHFLNSGAQFNLSNMNFPYTLSNLYAHAESLTCLNISSCSGVGLVEDSTFKSPRGVVCAQIGFSQKITVNDCNLWGTRFDINSSSNIRLNNPSYAGSFSQFETNPSSLGIIRVVNGATDVIVEGLTTRDEVPGYGQFPISVSNANNVTLKNSGTKVNPLYGVNNLAQLSACSDVVIANVHAGSNTSAAISTSISVSDITIQDCSQSTQRYFDFETIAAKVKGMQGVHNNANSLNSDGRGCVDTITYHTFTEDGTEGSLGFLFQKQSNLAVWSTTSGTPFFSDVGDLYMRTSGDQVVGVFDYFVLGMEAFQNEDVVKMTSEVSVGLAGSNIDCEYDLDTGSGFSGTWKTATGTNLSGETISPSDGFKIKIRLTANTSHDGNSINTLYFLTDTSQTSIDDNHYPIRPVTYSLTLTGLKNPSEVRLYKAGTTTAVIGQEDVSSGTFTWVYDPSTLDFTEVDIVIHALGYQYMKIKDLDISSGSNKIPVSQRIDRQYENA